jgi:DNA-binding response OmpR family regulator
MIAKHSARILVVDDDPLLLELLVDTLTAIGYEALPAADGSIALDILHNDIFDLMITDIKMPRIDGLQLLKKVKRHYPSMPVLFITGVASQEIIGHAEADGFLAKPFRIAHIEELIEQTLANKETKATGRRPELLVINADGRLGESFTDELALDGYVSFSFANVDDALRELLNNRFTAILADIPHWTVHPDHIIGRLRELAGDTPILVNEDILPAQSREEFSNRFFPLKLLPLPFSPASVTDALSQLAATPIDKP